MWAGNSRLVCKPHRDSWRHIYAMLIGAATLASRTSGEWWTEYVALTPDGRDDVYNAITGHTADNTDRRHLYLLNVAYAGPVELTSGEGPKGDPIATGPGWSAAFISARLRHLVYDSSVDVRKLQRIIDAFPRQGPQRRPSAGPSANFVLIVGLARYGTTLVDRILTGLPAVRSNGETENFARALLTTAPAAEPERVAALYASLAGGTADEAIVAKVALSYRYLGAICRAIPDARVLAAQRTRSIAASRCAARISGMRIRSATASRTLHATSPHTSG